MAHELIDALGEAHDNYRLSGDAEQLARASLAVVAYYRDIEAKRAQGTADRANLPLGTTYSVLVVALGLQRAAAEGKHCTPSGLIQWSGLMPAKVNGALGVLNQRGFVVKHEDGRWDATEKLLREKIVLACPSCGSNVRRVDPSICTDTWHREGLDD